MPIALSSLPTRENERLTATKGKLINEKKVHRLLSLLISSLIFFLPSPSNERGELDRSFCICPYEDTHRHMYLNG